MFQFLGTGGSAGVPVIGCKCAVCTSTNPKDRRFRPSGWIQITEAVAKPQFQPKSALLPPSPVPPQVAYGQSDMSTCGERGLTPKSSNLCKEASFATASGGVSLLIDVGPDFRSQALQFGIDHLDGLLLTHTHYDHIAGIDELRIFNVRQKKPFPCLLSQESFEEIQKRYYYFFRKDDPILSAKIECSVLENDTGTVEFLGIPVRYCTFSQCHMKVTGFRVGDFAYISDIRSYDPSIIKELKGVRKLVLSALKPEPSPFHFSFDQAASFAKDVGAEETWLTHLGHFIDHDAANALLPPEVRVAYDGLKIEFTCTN